jgi:hypothetical protein
MLQHLSIELPQLLEPFHQHDVRTQARRRSYPRQRERTGSSGASNTPKNLQLGPFLGEHTVFELERKCSQPINYAFGYEPIAGCGAGFELCG